MCACSWYLKQSTSLPCLHLSSKDLSWAGHAVWCQTETIGAIQQTPHRSVYSSSRAAAGKPTVVNMMLHWCSIKAAGMLLFRDSLPYHLHWASNGPLSPPWRLASPPPEATDTKEPVEYSQFWFRLCRQRRTIFPRGWRQLAWGRRRLWCQWGGALPICHRVRLW